MKSALALLASVALTGCAFAPGMYASGLSDGKKTVVAKDPRTGEAIPVAILPLSAATIEPDAGPGEGVAPEAPSTYRLGPGDVVNIVVWEHPELTIPQGEFRSAEAAGNLIDQDGSLFYPYCGLIRAQDKTRLELRAELVRCLSRVIRNPQVDVRISAFRSQRVHVGGAVMQPGIVPISDVPLYAMDAIQAAGGFFEEANPRYARVTRNGVVYPIDLMHYTETGDARHNPLLRDGDTLHVDLAQQHRVNVIGEVMRPQSIALNDTVETLADALAQAQGLNSQTAEPNRILVLRQVASGNAVLWLKGNNPMEMAAAQRFRLKSGDVVYVDQTGLTRWNRVISAMLPGALSGATSAAIITSGQ